MSGRKLSVGGAEDAHSVILLTLEKNGRKTSYSLKPRSPPTLHPGAAEQIQDARAAADAEKHFFLEVVAPFARPAERLYPDVNARSLAPELAPRAQSAAARERVRLANWLRYELENK